MTVRSGLVPFSVVINAVTLDLWNTLLVDRRGREREAMRADLLRAEMAAIDLSPPEHALAEGLAAGYEHFDRVWREESRTPSCAEIVDATLLHLRADLPREARARLTTLFEELLLQAPPEPVPGAPGVLRQLAERYRLGLICDTGYSPGRVLRRVLDANGMLDPLGYLYFSDEGGRSKPDRRVFHEVLEHLEVAPAESVHVGDIQRTDIDGAHRAGMWAIHFVGVNDYDATVSTGDAIARRLDELPLLVGELMCPGCGITPGSAKA